MILIKKFKRMLPEQLRAAYHSAKLFKQHFGYYPNFFTPKTFSEKIQKSKIFNRDPRMPVLQDKVLVKDVVAEKIGSEFIIPTLWHGSELPPREARNWPMPFVIKANHGCGWNIFVRNAQECSWPEIEAKCADWMSQTYGYHYGEWLYGQIRPQLLVEPFMSEVADLPADYKLWVFHGKVQYVQVISGRGTENKRQAFYDVQWQRQPFVGCAIANAEQDHLQPASLAKMVQASEVLAKGFDFVRVDFYEVRGQPLFGEMTFYPASGFSPIHPIEHEKTVGAFWH